MGDYIWAIERVDAPVERPFLHWVSDEAEPLRGRVVTEWPPTEEDLDYALPRVNDEAVVIENHEVAELLAKAGLTDADVRPFDTTETARLSAWRPYALVERLLENSSRITLHGARADVSVPHEMWSSLEGLIFPRLLMVEGLEGLDGTDDFGLLAVVRNGIDRWRLDVGDVPRTGQSLRTWLAGSHVRFTCPRTHVSCSADWSLSGVGRVRAAEQFIAALHAVAASISQRCDGLPVEATLDCSLTGYAMIRVLPPEAATGRFPWTA